eukprot:841325-Amorphochlora_amoeboformis.AAC.4
MTYNWNPIQARNPKRKEIYTKLILRANWGGRCRVSKPDGAATGALSPFRTSIRKTSPPGGNFEA